MDEKKKTFQGRITIVVETNLDNSEWCAATFINHCRGLLDRIEDGSDWKARIVKTEHIQTYYDTD